MKTVPQYPNHPECVCVCVCVRVDGVIFQYHSWPVLNIVCAIRGCIKMTGTKIFILFPLETGKKVIKLNALTTKNLPLKSHETIQSERRVIVKYVQNETFNDTRDASICKLSRIKLSY